MILRNPARGVSKVTALFFTALFLCVFYVAYRVIPFYYYYFELQNQAEQLVRIAPNESDAYIRGRLFEMLRRYEIPFSASRVTVERFDNGVYISVPYSEILDVEWQGKYYDLYEFKFHVEARTP